MQWLKNSWQQSVHLSLIPLGWLIVRFANNDLTVNPIQAATQITGQTALVLLILSLACTPLQLVAGWKQVLSLRRPLGLYGFLYASLHMLLFVVVDYGLDFVLIWDVVSEKPYIIAGLAALLLLIPLAITSTKGWKRRLGKGWKALHRLVYLAIPLVVLHFLWVVKDIRGPIMAGGVVAVLLVVRIPAIRQWFTRWHYQRTPRIGRTERA
ncbi:MAG: ferric reductase-like transmembrane domain-containing protein [Roseiflexaceae bacterium]